MKILVYFSLFLLSATIITSCMDMPYVPKRHQNSFSFCYQDKDTGIDSLLNINGYFRLKETTRATYGLDSSISIEDTSYYYIMFFRDGIFLSGLRDLDRIGIPKYFEKVKRNTELGKKELFYKAFYWGTYKISGDTIKTQVINLPSTGAPHSWALAENWYKVVDKSSIIKIYAKRLENGIGPYDFRKTPGNTYNVYGKVFTIWPGTFNYVPIIPGSDCWLKKEKWFWCNEEDWKKYKEKKSKKTH